jgi:predicted acylesterase/phospholipase RssA
MSPPTEKMTSYQFGPSISGWEVLWSRINPLLDPIKVPALPANLMRSMEVNSVYRVKTTESIADVLIEPEIRDYGTLDFEHYQPIIDVGYKAAMKELGRIKKLDNGRYLLA